MQHIDALIRQRRSVRSYDGRALDPADLQKLTAFMANIQNPYDIPVTFQLLDGARQTLKCPVVTGAQLFVGAKVAAGPHMEEAFGYAFETLVLYAQSLGIGTVWVGGTMDRPAFEAAMGLADNERMLCMSPLGYPAARMSLKETVMRSAIKADARLPFESLFFAESFDTPLAPANAGRLAAALEAVQLAPSAVNKQPWRTVVQKDAVHFYLRHAKGFAGDRNGDMQKVDMGIALCHFALVAEEQGLQPRFVIADPGLAAAADTEYIASYRLA